MTTGAEGGGSPSGEPELAQYAPGIVIARKYELTREIGEGGMGTVWLARNSALQVDVAIKPIRRGKSTDEQCRRLLQEARSAARIEHPSVVRIFDYGETEHGDPFIAMEFLRGEDLRDMLERQKRMPADDAVPLLLCVASALMAAHAKGIVHRDLKPENVFLVPGEGGVMVPKVVDFGIAKSVDIERDGGRVITTQGTLVGSPDYMSPEQARGAEDLDARSDVWSLCVVLYELLTGRMPFEGPNYGALVAAIIVDPPTPTTALLAGDKELWDILAKGLAKAPADRWQTMRDLGKELAAWAIAHEIETDAAGASIRRHWLGNSRRSLERVSLTGLDTTPPPSSGPSSSQPGVRINTGAPDSARSRSRTSASDIRRSTGASVIPSASPAAKRGPAVFVAIGVAVGVALVAVLTSMRSRPEPNVATAAAAAMPAPSVRGHRSAVRAAHERRGRVRLGVVICVGVGGRNRQGGGVASPWSRRSAARVSRARVGDQALDAGADRGPVLMTGRPPRSSASPSRSPC